MTTTTTPTRSDGSGAMFDAIAGRYDLVNRIISLGIDQSWREKTVAALNLAQGARVLDVATGTADLAIQIAKEGNHVVGLDPSERMLAIGSRKVHEAMLARQVELVVGDAQALQFADASFDGVSIAFGIRNVPDRARALREMARVTKPGGRVAVLELSEPETGGPLGRLARFHVHTLVPWLGALISGAAEYRYLQRSIAAFPSADAFAQLMQEQGLEILRVEPLTFGVCHLYVATPAR
ncbi:MAG TPA: bifunctional demethylmenaquinone methyltransferase/2-methoxy-6-polyprenyl-1,4-benzoquinol methylase UbiE [Polyangiaceae bacterium]|nr:bifunctional demethylmenaquinone methyltransferase/2-methoxy-6-polyprenyl-1,4-benzoquinol methylase UbiE [Polyangiaceae bacterium]